MQYLSFKDMLPVTILKEKIEQLPVYQQNKVKCFRSQRDKQTALAGKLLLLRGLHLLGIKTSLDQLMQNDFGKPYFKDISVGFNITHSGDFVACVISNETTEIGIDAEEINLIDVNEFKSCWTVAEWARITEGGLPFFYKLWTQKEALIKAEGRGLSIPLQDIEVSEQFGNYQHRHFFFESINVGSNVVMHLASETQIKALKIQHIDPAMLFY